MNLPVQITFRNLSTSSAVTARIKAEAGKLDRYYPRVTRCHVVIARPHLHYTSGEHFHFRIELGVPGSNLIVQHEPNGHRAMALNEGASASCEAKLKDTNLFRVQEQPKLVAEVQSDDCLDLRESHRLSNFR